MPDFLKSAFGSGPDVAPLDVLMRLLAALDGNKDGTITHDEFMRGFARWFAAWDADKKSVLSDEQLRAGINQDLGPARGDPFRPGEPVGPAGRPPSREQ